MQAEGLRIWVRLCSHADSAAEIEELRWLMTIVDGLSLENYYWICTTNLMARASFLLEKKELELNVLASRHLILMQQISEIDNKLRSRS